MLPGLLYGAAWAEILALGMPICIGWGRSMEEGPTEGAWPGERSHDPAPIQGLSPSQSLPQHKEEQKKHNVEVDSFHTFTPKPS